MGLKGDHTRLADAEVNLVSANGEEERPKKQNKCAKEGITGIILAGNFQAMIAPKNLTSQESDAILNH